MKRFFGGLIGRSTLSLVLLFMVLDALGAVFYYLYLNDILDSRFFRLGRDRGYFEVIEYLKTFLIIGLFRAVWFKSAAPVIRAWWILFWVMLLDNAIGLHEEIGALLAPYFSMIDVLAERGQDVAELFVMACLEGVALLYVIYCYFISPEIYRQFSRVFVALVCALAGVSVVVEVLHFSAFEEAVEIVGTTFLLAFVHLRYRGVYLERMAEMDEQQTS